jgi:hypothetical protein
VDGGGSSLCASRLRLGKPAYALRDSVLASQPMRFATPSWQASLCASRLRLGKPPQGSRTAAERRPYPRGTWSASRHDAATPFVSIGRGAAPPGPLTSGDAVAVSRRWGRLQPMRFATPAWQAAAGVGRRRRAVPTLGELGALRALVRQHLRANW